MNKVKRFFKRLPRFSFVLGKKQIIIGALVVVLGGAVYINYLYANSSGLTEDKGKAAASYGEEKLVSGGKIEANLSTADAYFAQARIDKQASRDEAKEFLSTMYGGGDATGEEMAVFAANAEVLSGYMESETRIETVLKAQGFDDVLCYLSNGGANIIVKTDGLTPEGAAKIKNALLTEVDVSAENITVVEIR
ncbi:MAG: SpoIIIAH-like family protein [Oscillospiraceae bacterium]|jgi:stage III sporulation protein AH|nr:SpoIIIAH-like family protein [Oscillospiraceae bacterium]